MSKIQIDDSIFSDERFIKLVMKTKNVHAALGMHCASLFLAKPYYLKNELIPHEKWPEGLHILFDVELCAYYPEGVDVYSAHDSFDSLRQFINKKIKSKK